MPQFVDFTLNTYLILIYHSMRQKTWMTRNWRYERKLAKAEWHVSKADCVLLECKIHLLLLIVKNWPPSPSGPSSIILSDLLSKKNLTSISLSFVNYIILGFCHVAPYTILIPSSFGLRRIPFPSWELIILEQCE